MLLSAEHLVRFAQVDADGIADRHRRSLMEAALADYLSAHPTAQTLSEADWSKVRGLEFREALEQRDRLQKELEFVAIDDNEFEESVRSFPTLGVLSPLTIHCWTFAVSNLACRTNTRGQDRWVS